MAVSRRSVLRGIGAGAASALASPALAQSFTYQPNQRYPDPAIEILDPSFLKYRLYSSSVEMLGSGMRWAEGPVYFPGEGYLLLSDIPNNRIMKYNEKDNSFTVFRSPSDFANGNTRDRQGRLVTCEHSVTRRITRTEKNGKITVLADSFEGKRLNAPNDIVVKSDDSIWFTDPPFGILGDWEGFKAKPEQANTNVFRIGADGKLTAIWSYDVGADGSLSNKTKLIDAADQGSPDGFRVDRDGNLWCGWGSNGLLQSEPTDVNGRKVYQLKGKSADLDGVKVFSAEGKPLAHIHLPERCANVAFGGPKDNRLYMAASHSLYALYVEAHGAT
jgi:gluconolactonase